MTDDGDGSRTADDAPSGEEDGPSTTEGDGSSITADDADGAVDSGVDPGPDTGGGDDTTGLVDGDGEYDQSRGRGQSGTDRHTERDDGTDRRRDTSRDDHPGHGSGRTPGGRGRGGSGGRRDRPGGATGGGRDETSRERGPTGPGAARGAPAPTGDRTEGPRSRGGDPVGAPMPSGEQRAGAGRGGGQGRAGSVSERDAGLSAVLSFLIPGVGQLYNGQVARGAVVLVALFVWEFLALMLTIFSLGFFIFVWILVEFVVHVVAAYDAYDQAEKINAGQVAV